MARAGLYRRVARLRILFVVSECVPFAKTGGLADVAGALPVALAARGHDVRVVMPRYRCTEQHGGERLDIALRVRLNDAEEHGYLAAEHGAAVWRAQLDERVPVYLVERNDLYDRDGIYGDEHGSFGDNPLRYAFLCAAARQLSEALDFRPDVLHLHDWQTTLAAVHARRSQHPVASVLTIHNLGYQGICAGDDHRVMGLSWQECLDMGIEQHGHLNLLKAGLCNATLLSTVSPRYAQEIQTPQGGAGLDGELRWRASDLFGILNGIDDERWNPTSDPLLPANYSADDLTGKAICKQTLQQKLSLPQNPNAPLIGVVSRLVEQKGVDIILEAMPKLVSMGAQLAILGNGPRWVEQAFSSIAQQSPQVRCWFGFDERLAHNVEAAADLFLMPSRYEPCGLNQMYSQRYGTLPIVRAVGGLLDSVDHGVNGFHFSALSGDALAAATAEAIKLYRESPARFRTMQLSAMRKEMGWKRAARQYEALYRLAIHKRRHNIG